MRLPLRHPPPGRPAGIARCLHLEELARASEGLVLGPASEQLMRGRSRGRYGNALQWHFGLAKSDALAELDWENRIEIKLVSVWRRSDGSWACDKLKVCDHAIDPWHKLSNVLWVCADRMTRVILGTHLTTLSGDFLNRLSRSWSMDPHFDRPDLWIESRESEGQQAPAYYLTSSILQEFVLDPARLTASACPVMFDGVMWTHWRQIGASPRFLLTEAGRLSHRCPSCGEALELQNATRIDRGWAELMHPRAMGRPCERSVWLALDGGHVPSSMVMSRDEQASALLDPCNPSVLFRLADVCPEPDDHMH